MTEELNSYERYEPKQEKPYMYRICRCGHLFSNHNSLGWLTIPTITYMASCDKCKCPYYWQKRKLVYEELPNDS